MNRLVIFILIILVSGLSPVLADDGVSRFWYNAGGDWTIADITEYDGTSYNAITDEGFFAYRCYGARTGGGVDTFWYSGSYQKANLDTDLGSTIEYADLASTCKLWDPAQYSMRYQFYGLRVDGGIDLIQYSYTTEKYERTAIGESSGIEYNAIASDGLTFFCIYAAKPAGGVDKYLSTDDGSTWTKTSLTFLDGRVYNDISDNPGNNGLLYGARQGGGIDVIDIPSAYVGQLGTVGYISGLGGTTTEYKTIQADTNRGNWLYGCKYEGGIDVLMDDALGGLFAEEMPGTKGIKFAGISIDDRAQTVSFGWGMAIKGEDLQSCDELLMGEFGFASDIYPDCIIDLMDLQVMAGQWLNCNDPNTSNCP